MVVIVTSKGEETLELRDGATLLDLKKAYKPHVSVHRKSFRVPPAKEGDKPVMLNGDDKKLADLGVKPSSKLIYKDLGPQVGYRTVFVVEYAGPIAIMALYALRPSLIYGNVTTPLGPVQQLYIGLFIAHFVKRELETFFVHKFSRPTMPLFNIFKNSIYYWSFAAFIGYFLAHPQYTPPTHGLETAFAALWGLFELGNFAVHYQLSTMRKEDGDTSRNVPKGLLFSLVSCPNYTFEVLGWVAFSAGSSILMSWVFTVAGLLQMTDWALKKHKGYIKADAANKKKKSIIPFII